MSSAAEARFRVQAPNSTPRATIVIALDAAGEAVVRRLAGAGWEHATFLTAANVDAARAPSDEGRVPSDVGRVLLDPADADVGRVLLDPASIDQSGRPRDLVKELNTTDLVVLVAGPGGRADAASVIGEACSRRRVMTTGFIVGASAATERELSKTLAQIRPYSLMVVIANDDEYIDDMLTALRA